MATKKVSPTDHQTLKDMINELVDYVKKRQNQDPLVMGFDRVRVDNPLRRESPYKCAII